jgi:hypothetical protein
VALLTTDGYVTPGEREDRGIVAEGGRLPGGRRVARSAVMRQLAGRVGGIR